MSMDILVSIRLSEPKLMLNCPVPLWYEHGNAICPSGCSRSGADHNDMIYLLSLSIGIVAGLRAMTAPAAVSWAAYLGWLKLDESILAFMGYAWTAWVITVLAVAVSSARFSAQPAPWSTLTRTGSRCSGTFRCTTGSRCCIAGLPLDGHPSLALSTHTGTSPKILRGALPGGSARRV
jgi:hypothetical protein